MYTSFEELKKDCLKCNKCPLAATRTNVVFGVGPEDAEVLFIGEGPGENEDLTGQPFVGRGGKLLDQYLYDVDLDRNKNIYIANIVKCRPPKNRDPQPLEQESCEMWLREQVRLMRPKIIVCLGRIAAQKIISPDFKVTKQHGEFLSAKVPFDGNFSSGGAFAQPEQQAGSALGLLALRDKINEICERTY